MIFLKLGGSLITEKANPETPRLDMLRRLAQEIADARHIDPALRLLIGHGSGSFGHAAASRHATQHGASTPEQWLGFVEVWRSANRLNRIVVDALSDAGLPVLSFPPSASALARSGEVTELADLPIQRALGHGLIPLVQGDVAFDSIQGACILSTERVFTWLAPRLRPGRILLVGAEAGVFSDFPANTNLLPQVSQHDLAQQRVGASAEVDVTGGMAEKVRFALEWARVDPAVEIRIFSGEEPGHLRSVLLGGRAGTQVIWLGQPD